jgi:hypothetical protein
MAKEDFCFTYYDGDAASDMQFMNRLERGAYSDLVLFQRRLKGKHLTLDQIRKILGKDFDSCWAAMEVVLKQDEHGMYYLEWLAKSEANAKAHAQHQANNGRKGGIATAKRKRQDSTATAPLQQGSSETQPLRDEDENGNEDLDQDADELYGKCENFFHGAVPADLLELAGRLKPMPEAGEWQDYVQKEITKLGYTVNREIPCDYADPKTGKMIRGRIDLEVDKPQENGFPLLGIELDYRQPRLKSIRKVETYRAGIVLLRDPKPVVVIPAKITARPAMVTSSTLQDASRWTDQVIENNDELFNNMLRKRGVSAGEHLEKFARDHLDLTAKYNWFERWSDQNQFRHSLLKHISDEVAKIKPNKKSKSTAIDNLD